jgi:hypothetical protein
MNSPRKTHVHVTNAFSGRGVGVDQTGLDRLNKSDMDLYVETTGSDPNHPTYGAAIEVLHQLHCLVRPPSEDFLPEWAQ